MSVIEFEQWEDSFELLNPLNNFTFERQRVRVFKDPLLGHTSVYNPAIEDGLKVFLGDVDEAWLKKLAEDTEQNCLFCSARQHLLARYPDGFIDADEVRVGEALVFPNLFALAGSHSVAIISRKHFLRLEEFAPGLIRDAFLALQNAARASDRKNPDYRWLSVHSNYLPPAGASQLHPHFQMLASSQPYQHQAQLAQACQKWQANHDQAYHACLIKEEQEKQSRYIAATGPWHWLAAYAPLGSNELVGIHENQADFLELSYEDINQLAAGLSHVLAYFGHLGYFSFNFSLYALRHAQKEDGFSCVIRVMTRQNPAPNYRGDDFYLQKGLSSELMLAHPEVLATGARGFFNN